MAKTLQERFQAALEARGETVVKRLTGCIVMTRTKNIMHDAPIKAGVPMYFYLGKAGSLRFGASKANSIPVSDGAKRKLLGD